MQSTPTSTVRTEDNFPGRQPLILENEIKQCSSAGPRTDPVIEQLSSLPSPDWKMGSAKTARSVIVSFFVPTFFSLPPPPRSALKSESKNWSARTIGPREGRNFYFKAALRPVNKVLIPRTHDSGHRAVEKLAAIR